MRGGVFLILLLVLNVAKGQGDPCITPAECDEIKVELVKSYSTVSPSCGTNEPSTCLGDQFYQMTYKVYLRYRIPNPGTPGGPGLVHLNYKNLAVGVNLFGSLTHSKINKKSTQYCYNNSPNGQSWNNYTPATGYENDKPIFEVLNDKDALITFNNTDPTTALCGGVSGTGTNRITFDFNAPQPPNTYNDCGANFLCAYVELFTLIVDAYPEDILRLKTISSFYEANTNPVVTCNFSTINGGDFNAFSNATIPNPSSYASTENENLKLRIGGAVATNMNGQYEVPLYLINSGNQNINVDYLEFMLDAHALGLDQPMIYSVNTPEVTQINNSNGNYFDILNKLFYKINLEGVTVSPGQSNGLLVAKITTGPALLQNINWYVTFSFEEINKARIKTEVNQSKVCTKLNIIDTEVTAQNVGNPVCSEYNVHFFQRLVPDVNSPACNDYKLRLGLIANENFPAGLKISAINLTAQIDHPSIVFDGSLLTANWPYVNCAATATCGSFGGDCHDFQQSNNTFQYCYSFNNAANAPVFFANGNNINYLELPLQIPEGECLENVMITHLTITYFDASGVAIACVPYPDPAAGFPGCAYGITGTITTPANEGVEDVEVVLTHSGANCSPECAVEATTNTAPAGGYGFCEVCPGCDTFTINPKLNLDPLNGVNTWDLVLISRHILGLEPLNSPYKLISADANKSGTVTTFDNVELRKLILGTYLTLPNNTSWRFIDATQVFSDPGDPFADAIKEMIKVSFSSLPATNVNFIGCKVGDVDWTATPNNKAGMESTTISSTVANADGALVTLPVQYTGVEEVLAVQFGLNFEPDRYEFIGVSIGDVLTMSQQNFGLSRVNEGVVGFSWNASDLMQTPVAEGQVLFYLTLRRLSRTSSDEVPTLSLGHDGVPSALAWKPDGGIRKIELAPGTLFERKGHSEKKISNSAILHPNPAGTQATPILEVDATQAGKARLAVLSAFGQRLFLHDFEVEKGINREPLPKAGQLPAGIYQWALKMPDGEMLNGQLIIQ